MLAVIVEPLLKWYEENKRALPWRGTGDAYAVWVSEIMLQQTRVEAVRPYYERFLRELPTPSALAACPEERLLKLWEGLGYYSRVRNMQKAAQVVAETYGGRLPADYEALRALPGIGNYTAGAVASIAYGIPVPAVDGNVLRVIARIREDDGDIGKQSVRRRVEEELSRVIPRECPGTWNQALMELGAMICVPNGAPKCGSCPVAEFCGAARHGTQERYPVKKKPPARRIEERTVLLLLDGSRTAVRRRPKKGLLGGLYEFPNLTGRLGEPEALEQVRAMGLSPLRIQPLPEAKHIFSHVEWHMTGYAVRIEEPEGDSVGELLFAQTDEARERYPVPAAFAAYAKYVNLKLGPERLEKEKSEGTDK